jgi:serine/threonine protein kinase
MKCPKCQSENPPSSKFCAECGTPLPSSAEFHSSQAETLQAPIEELTTGLTFAGRYQVIGVLGHGGMGKVYKVLDKKLDVEIALKLIKPEVALDEHIIEELKNELRLIRDISLQIFCRTYDLSEDMGRYFITMEYVPGKNLKSTIHSVGSLNLSRTLAIAKQICEGLAAAHRLDIIHGDLKPQNIMLNPFGIVRIMDLGISRFLQSRGITADGIMIGTPGYISPEQAKGSKVDARSDIYSLGAILFEMVTGKVPVEGDTALSVILEQKQGPPPDPGALVPHPPKGISRIILKCLEKDRDRRYANVEALYADLEREEREIRATDEIPNQEIEEPGQAEPGVRPYAIIGISLALIAALIGGYLFLGRAKKEPGGDAKISMPAVSETAQPKSSPPIPSVDASPQIGSVEIDSIPPNATIVLNGKPEGTTPLKKEMPPGRYEIKVAKPPGYREAADFFALKAGEKFSKTYGLIPVFILEIITVPEGADILIDGVLQGKTPRELTIAKNSCQMELRRGRGVPVLTEFLNLNPGRNTIRRAFRQAKFGLTINTIPPGANVIIGNEAAAISPVTKTMDPGRYAVKIEKEGFRSVQESLTVEADVVKTYELAKLLPGKVRFNVYPYANVFIDDKLVGEVPPVETMELAEGKYTLKFVSTGLGKTLTVVLEIRSEENKEVRVNMATGESKIIKL